MNKAFIGDSCGWSPAIRLFVSVVAGVMIGLPVVSESKAADDRSVERPVSINSSESMAAVTRDQLQQDWLIQAQLRYGIPTSQSDKITPAADAVGACDGVINGEWGFHTGLEENPWWQVDLGEIMTIDSLRIYNRCDGFEDRAARVRVLCSEDGEHFSVVYIHDGTPFGGHTDSQPLTVPMNGHSTRFVRLQLPGKVYLHLDEVEVLAGDGAQNVALGKPCTQSSISPWSVRHVSLNQLVSWPTVVRESLQRGRQLVTQLESAGVSIQDFTTRFDLLQQRVEELNEEASALQWQAIYFDVRQATRKLAFMNPLLDFDRVLFVKRAPSMFPHLSDQYYGWWARPGGGLYLLEGLKSERPTVQCLTRAWPEGNFLRPDISYDGQRVLFAFSAYDASIADEQNKRDKRNVPESVFYHLFEMDFQTATTRQLTHGKYDDFDGRYLPSNEKVFLSTRKGQFSAVHAREFTADAARTLPDSYVRCGGNDYRPVPVFTMHKLSSDEQQIWPVSAFETFEYTPSVTQDGRLLYCRWDYIDRFNGHFFSLWSANADGTNGQLVYGNYTKAPQATLEPRSVPGSNKIIFTGAAHHSVTGGSLVLLDQNKGNEGATPITRLTSEVPFPETEKDVDSYYANPYPLSEDFYLVSWSNKRLPPHGRYENEQNPVDAQGIYLLDRFGNLELLHRDPTISSMTPLPVRPRPRAATVASHVDWRGQQVGTFVLQDVYQGLVGIKRGEVKRLRVIGVVPKVQPRKDVPHLGVSEEETGKFVLGSVPVEADGSAHFQVPSGVPLFFQALDDQGMALQTMRSLTYVQPGQTLACLGCHESRSASPAEQMPLAVQRGPSKIRLGVDGTWPLRFDQLVQPVLDAKCVSCHANGADARADAAADLDSGRAWQTLLGYADNDLAHLVFERDASVPRDNPARQSRLLQYLRTDEVHREIELTKADHQRLFVWMDTYGQVQGAFSAEQEQQLAELRKQYRGLFED